MSDSEASDFRLSDSESDGYVAAPKAKKAPVKKAAAPKALKPPAAKKAGAKKAPLASKKNLPNDSDSGDDTDGSLSPAPPKSYNDEDHGIAPPKPALKKSASETYQKLSQVEHVLRRPDTYIGSIEPHTQAMWVVDPETKMMVNRTITYVPGFFKIFDEILVNAADNKVNDPTMDTIKVVIDREKNRISVWNNGKGIPVEMHSKEKVMIPELIFGHLLAGSNFDDDQKKLTGGRNGYGAKLANIYSHEFVVETADKSNMKKYKQVFSNNMSKKGVPKITDNKKGEEWTQISFAPDLARFGMASIDDDTTALLMKRVYDMAGTVKDIKVLLNGERLKVKNFKQYVEMYLAANNKQKSESSGGAVAPKPTVIYEQVNKRWEVAFAMSDGEFKQVSFANSIATTKGGTHVDMIATQLANKLLESAALKKNKAAPVKAFQVKSHMWIFVNALIENPSFDSQTKETLTLKSSAFGSKCLLSDEFVKKVSKSGVLDNVLSWARFKQDQLLKKTDGHKRARVGGIAKLEDANWAGGRNAKKCTLILTEGDSAKALAVSGLGAIQGRDTFGVFPLRGKLLNVRDAGYDQITKNQEIENIKKILGLKHNFDYKSVDTLRYGQLMIMTDQDHDGSHIKGLIINFLDHFYPSLLKLPNFLVEFITPIVKVKKGKQELTFFTMPQYEDWKEAHNGGRGWEAKYYKGLGTSEAKDAVKYFGDLEKHRLSFQPMGPEDKSLIDMAFNKKKADDRKEWLRQYKPGTFLDHDIKEIPIQDFVNKELVLFSMADNIRSIPSMVDGLKPGQRKVLFGAFKKNLKKEIKVVQLAGYVSENTAYHHGEQSLTATIVGLAQNFVGSNNVNLLMPNGQFGTRMQGGKDAASARYIFTDIPNLTRAIYHAADDPLLNFLVEDGQHIEPEWYMPTVPMVLINGADGIGTGWSTSIPNYNPMDVVENIRRLMRGEELSPMVPWWRGFRGTVERIDGDKYKVSGMAVKTGDNTIEITELPVRKWTQDFKEMIEEMTSGNDKIPSTIKDYEEHHTDTTVHFKLQMKEAGMKLAEQEGFEKRFKLSTTFSTSNMVCFDLNGKIKKYPSPEHIIQDFYPKRLEFYGLRKQNLADVLQNEFEKLSNQVRFIKMIIAKKLSVSNRKKGVIVAELRELNFRPFPKNGIKASAAGETEAYIEEEDQGSDSDYDYLMGMPIYSLTLEKVEALEGKMSQKEGELLELLKLTPEDIWNQDLDNFLEEWTKCLEGDQALAKVVQPKKGAAAARARKRAKVDGSDNDSDDFKPAKIVRARAPAKPKAVKPVAAAASLITPSETPSAAPSAVSSPRKRSSEAVSSGSEQDEKPPVKRANVGRPKKKPVSIDIDDSDDDSADKAVYTLAAPVAHPAPEVSSTASSTGPAPSKSTKAPAKSAAASSKATVKRRTATISDSDDDVVVAKPKGRAAPRRKVIKEEDDSDIADLPLKKPAASKKTAPKAKQPNKGGDFSDDELDLLPRSTTASKKAVPKAKRTKKVESDFENDSDDVAAAPPPRATTSRSGRAAAAKKPTYIDLDLSDDDDEF